MTDRSILLFKLPQCQLSHCLPISSDLLSNELLICRALVNFSVVQLNLSFHLLLDNTHICHTIEQEIEMVHHLVPFGLVIISALSHLIQ